MSIKEPSIFGRWVGIQVNPNNKKQLYIILERDVQLQKEGVDHLNGEFGGVDVALCVKEIRRKMK